MQRVCASRTTRSTERRSGEPLRLPALPVTSAYVTLRFLFECGIRSNLRSDSLAQILAFANVYAGVQVTVFDTCMGLVVSSVLERLGGIVKLM